MRCGTRGVARVAHRAAHLTIGTPFDTDHQIENHFSIGAPGEARWPFKNSDSAVLAAVAWLGSKNPSGLTRCSNQKMVFDMLISIKKGAYHQKCSSVRHPGYHPTTSGCSEWKISVFGSVRFVHFGFRFGSGFTVEFRFGYRFLISVFGYPCYSYEKY